VLAVVLTLDPAASVGQTHMWSHRFGDTNLDRGYGNAVDGAGNVFVTGEYRGDIDFGGGLLPSEARIFIVKFGSTGSHVWSMGLGSAAGGGSGQDVVVDGVGNVLVTGNFWGTVDFGGGQLTSAGSNDIFVAKYDTSGNHLWSRGYGDDQNDQSWCIAVDGVGNVVVTGDFVGTIDLGGGMLTSAGSSDIFIAKYNAMGNHVWSYRFGSSFPEGGKGVAADGVGNVVATGAFWGSVDFGGGVLTSTGSNDIYVVKFDAAGNHIWSQDFGNGLDGGTAVALDGVGNVLVTGWFAVSADFGGGLIPSAGNADVFVAKFDPLGNHIWSGGFGGTGIDRGASIDSDGAGNVLVAGYFRDTVNFGGGPLTSAGSDDIFMAKYDPLGSPMWSSRFGDTGADLPQEIAADGMGDAIATGYFRETVDFGGGPLTSAGGEDIFVAKYTSRDPTGIGDLATRTIHLWQNHPNPFNPTTRIAFSLERKAHVSLSIYDVSGRLVATLVDRRMEAGTHFEEWDGRDGHGMSVASGIYFYRLSDGNQTLARKAVLLQ
jgi:hypothetical protein